MNSKLFLGVTTAMIRILIIAVALFSIYLLVVGQGSTRVVEGEGRSVVIGHEPYPAAILSLFASVMLVVGDFRKIPELAWSGLVLLLIFTMLFLFSSGGALLPIALLMLFLMSLNSFVEKKIEKKAINNIKG